MNLAQRYATILKSVDAKKVLAYMKHRGHLSLLPKVVKVLEREPETGDVVVVAHEKEVSKFKKKYPDARIEVNPMLVGGHIVRSGTTITDASYRHALVQLYHNTIT